MKQWKWYFVFNVGVLALIFGQYQYNLMSTLYEADSTLLTFFILGITLLTSVVMGVKSGKIKDEENNMFWFVSDAVLSLGMVGTLFGFLLVLGSAFMEIDTSSTESMTKAIAVLASGMSTALVTSLVGLVSSLWLKLQLVILED
jgi:hypothetical protein